MADDTAQALATSAAPAARPAVPKASTPTHIILTADCRQWRAGQVLEASADLIALLDAEKAEYREASAAERNIGGFPA